MSGDKAMPVFFLGLLLLVVSVTLANRFSETVSWWPTLVYIPALIFVLFGQLWFLGAFAEQPEASGAAFLMFGLICVLPSLITLGNMWGTEYDFIKWSGVGLLVPPVLLLLLTLWPAKWTRQPTEEDYARAREQMKKKLPG